MAATQLFFEDFSVGQRFDGASRTITQADVHAFSALTGDAHPIHYDADFARQTPFGRPVVHGLHLVSLTALGATPLSDRLRSAMIALIEQGGAFRKPVFIGDTVRSVFEVADTEGKAGRDWGRVRFKVSLLRDDDVMLDAFHRYQLRRRSPPHS